MTEVLAPCPGRVFAITEVSDPVFAQELVGPGIAIEPAPGRTTVVAPVAGTILKLHPHAFAMVTAAGLGILVHLGINTVRLDGAGFELVAAEGDTVAAGDPMVSWDPAEIRGDEISTTVMVVVLDRPAGTVSSPALGHDVAAGEPLFSVDG
ncbi:MAG: PTS glucose transporter subunit IIA [Propionibacteriaceae bacterium]|nr:PTS glucose transporter subunit IIA [Propionibacteriaceae bacterium]